mmetsp:Transcript_22653/g.47250  ORF Transcript_22653/g.47250 Transcript_22653/m.47250 type:complete len:211 (-) Transcript_22653:488-1120(-)
MVMSIFNVRSPVCVLTQPECHVGEPYARDKRVFLCGQKKKLPNKSGIVLFVCLLVATVQDDSLGVGEGAGAAVLFFRFLADGLEGGASAPAVGTGDLLPSGLRLRLGTAFLTPLAAAVLPPGLSPAVLVVACLPAVAAPALAAAVSFFSALFSAVASVVVGAAFLPPPLPPFLPPPLPLVALLLLLDALAVVGFGLGGVNPMIVSSVTMG